MKISEYLLLSILLLCVQQINLDPNKDYDLEDEPIDGEDGKDHGHLIPDINCLVNDFPELFGFPKKVVNERVVPQTINHDIDPFIVFLNSILEEKVEDVDLIISIGDINTYYELEDEKYNPLKEILNECAKIPKKFSLNIIELNYLYCAIVWKNGFELYNEELTTDEKYKEGFFKIIENTIQSIFDYKVYLKDIVINKYTMKYWQNFYENLLEFNDLNVNYVNYDKVTIVEIKTKNYFFNEEKYFDLNIFFRFYKNYEVVLRALNKSFFYFYISDNYLMGTTKKFCESFEDIIIKEVYGSIFYLLMRNDVTFLENMEANLISKNHLKDDMQEPMDIMTNDIREQIQEMIEREKNFNLASVLGVEEERELPVVRGSSNPLLNTDINKYKLPKKVVEDTLPPKMDSDLIKQAIDKAKEVKAKEPYFRQFLSKIRPMGDTYPNLDERGRKLEEVKNVKKIKNEKPKKKDLIAKRYRGNENVYIALNDIENAGTDKSRKLREEEKRKLFELPVQPDISDPSKFFERIDFIKKPLDLVVKRTTLTEFFNEYEERTKDYYGAFANVSLIKICKQHMNTKIPALTNIFCLILQRETSILLQQKYSNSKVRAFIDKYFKFITFNFFTYFKILEDKGDLIEIEALTLFFCEKFFSSVKLAIVSFNNLLLHFEEEYRDYYLDKIQDLFMPLLNKFKKTISLVFLEFKHQITPSQFGKIVLEEDEIKLLFLPDFRKVLEEKVIQPSFDSMNLKNVEVQYQNYVNGMNLLSYDKIKQNFIYFSQNTGVKKSSEPPSNLCMTLHIEDIVMAHKKMKDAQSATKEEPDAEDEECIKDWRLYDEVFHYVFFNTKSKKIIIKKKTDVDSPAEKNAIQSAIENELIRVVNGFIPSRMKEKFDNFNGENRSGLETCGILQEYSRIQCFSIFGNNNCSRVPNTLYYTRKCPKGFKREGIACVYNCESMEMKNKGEFCIKNPDLESLPCPEGTVAKGTKKCLKPMKRYFIWIMNPFNNLL